MADEISLNPGENQSWQGAQIDNLSGTPSQQAYDAAKLQLAQSQSDYDAAQRAVLVFEQSHDINKLAPGSADAAAYDRLLSTRGNTRIKVEQSARDFATTNSKIASDATKRASLAKDPDEKNLWVAQAQRADSQAKLYDAQAAVVGAKSKADLLKAQGSYDAAEARAKNVGATTDSVIDKNSNQALLSGAKATQVEALTLPMVDHLRAQTVELSSRSTLDNARAEQSAAYTDQIIPALAAKDWEQAGYTHEQAQFLHDSAGAKIGNIQAQATLRGIQGDKIVNDIKRANAPVPVTPKDIVNGQVVQRNPLTGDLNATDIQGLKSPTEQALTQRASAVAAIQQQIASGQLQPDQANQMLGLIDQSLQAQIMGTTPAAYAEAQARTGEGILNNRVSNGTAYANTRLSTLLQAAGKLTRPLPNNLSLDTGQDAVNLVNQLGGGQGVADNAAHQVSYGAVGGPGIPAGGAPGGVPPQVAQLLKLRQLLAQQGGDNGTPNGLPTGGMGTSNAAMGQAQQPGPAMTYQRSEGETTPTGASAAAQPHPAVLALADQLMRANALHNQ